MFSRILALIVTRLLKLRYRINIRGLENIRREKGRGMLFLPNHPAMIDPVIVSSILVPEFHPHIIVDDEQIHATALKFLVRPLKLLPLPDIGLRGKEVYAEVEKAFKDCVSLLNSGEDVLMYPAGQNYRSCHEDLQGNAGVQILLQYCPDVRVIMIRTSGLWGSSFSRSSGETPVFRKCMLRNLGRLLLNLVFFCPRRTVHVTFEEAGADLPRQGGKAEINSYLERFYNADSPGNTYVPYLWWERGGPRVIPEPAEAEDVLPDKAGIPPEIREKVRKKLCETASMTEVKDEDLLGRDLGMDSLMIFEICTWVRQEFGQTVATPEALRRVRDVMYGAMGLKSEIRSLNPIPPKWFLPPDDRIHRIMPGCRTITESFLAFAAAEPDFPLLADQTGGVLTNRKIVLSILALKGSFEQLPGDRVGIIMPACAPFFVIFMAALFAGKTPVLLNWTVGPRNLAACAKKSEVQAILSAKQVITQLEARGTDFSAVKEKIVYLEDLAEKITAGKKLLALLRSFFCRRTLRSDRVPETAAILFTSGSESEPKAVPLTHDNFIRDVEYAIRPLHLRMDDCILGMLPPFHSFGLMIGVMLPAVTNMRTVFHTNPTEGAMLAKLIAAYQPTMIVGTPTFAEGILAHGTRESLKSIRIIITGAEKCPQSVLDLCHDRCPEACFLEGYGITECSPIVALNHPDAFKRNSIGLVLECLKWMIRGEDGSVLGPNAAGMLFVSGPSVFHGYLGYDGPSPFEEIDGNSWYRTGDLVEADEKGFLTFKGRLKRFIKVAGEMVSLPAVEDALLEHFQGKAEGVPLAVEAAGADSDPEIILFATFDVDKNEANSAIREAGFSPIHYIRRVVRLEEIPLLGTGKTDYRTLKKLLQAE